MLTNLSIETDKWQDMFIKEMDIKDTLISNLEEKLAKKTQENKELNLKLRVPRLHLEFLEEKGTLEDFVRAKLLG